MCGIAGFVGGAAYVAEQHRNVEALLDWQHRRGPFDRGTATLSAHNGGVVVLGNNRLAVVDTSATGRQPMACNSGDLHISYNGEIYNHLELRAELEKHGVRFRGGSDTEVILEAWRRWGEKALDRFNGMFAFALYNKRENVLFLARDRFGVKPMFWTQIDGGVLFASSAAALATVVGARPNLELGLRGVSYKLFDDGSDVSQFEGILALRASCIARIDCGVYPLAPIERSYYSLAREVESRTMELAGLPPPRLERMFDDLLQDAVTLRLRADCPVALTISGGIDSCMIGALAAERIGAIDAFSFASPNAPESEGALVELFCRNPGIRAHYEWPALDRSMIGAAFDQTLDAQEAPFSGVSVVAQNLVYEAVSRSGYRVTLGGQGADEILCGYSKYFLFALRFATRQRQLGGSLSALISTAMVLASSSAQIVELWGERHRYLSQSTRRDFSLIDGQAPRLDLGVARHPTMAARQISDVLHMSLPTLLRYEDRNSMHHSVESRLPYMDHRLVEFAIALPDALKIQRGYGKWVLRAAARGRVPDRIRLNRRKRGFDVAQDWIRTGLGAHLRESVAYSWNLVSQYTRKGVTPDSLPSDDVLAASGTQLDEMILLAWLASIASSGRIMRSPTAEPANLAARLCNPVSKQPAPIHI